MIKIADKGSSAVILSKDQHAFEVRGQLSDIKYYKVLENPIYPETIPIVNRIFENLAASKIIAKTQLEYLKPDGPIRLRRF